MDRHYWIHHESNCCGSVMHESSLDSYEQCETHVPKSSVDKVIKDGYDFKEVSIFEEFIADEQEWDMFVTGNAGTGKTTEMREYVQYCIDNKIPYVCCAFTHKACGILAGKLPKGARIQTLHSYLQKRPTVNTEATKISQVKSSIQTNKPDEEPKILFLDEFSMVGEKDTMDIRAAQDPEYLGVPKLKLVAFGDLKQLPPVGDVHTLKPGGKYHRVLTKQWRNDNPLQIPLNKLIAYIDKTEEPAALEEVPGYFIRGIDLNTAVFPIKDKIYLAYTNRRVEDLNSMLQGYQFPAVNDMVFSPSTQHTYQFLEKIEDVEYIDLHYSDPLHLGSKFKTLEGLLDSENCDFGLFEDLDGKTHIFAYVFGHYRFKRMREELESAAVNSNRAIEKEFKGYKAVTWAKANYTHKLARERAKAWREYLSFNDCVICMDFTHAMTVHKGQGSTFNTVIIDTHDLAICAERDFEMYLKLAYVAISRASHKVYTS